MVVLWFEKVSSTLLNSIVKLFHFHCTILRDLALLHRDLTSVEDVCFHAKAVSFRSLGNLSKRMAAPGLLLFIPFAPVFQYNMLASAYYLWQGFSVLHSFRLPFPILSFPPYSLLLSSLTVLPDSLIFRIKYFPLIAHS